MRHDPSAHLRRTRRVATRFVAGENGAAVVEFALVVPVLFLVVFAVIDFGRALYTQNVLIAAVREGARYGASRQTPAQAVDSAKYQTACYIGRVLKGAADCAAAITAYPVSNVSASYSAPLLTVQLTSGYDYNTTAFFTRKFGLGTITFHPIAVFRWEQGS